MQIQEIRGVPRRLGTRPGDPDKIKLIRAIQLSEGNFDCFATAYDGVCEADSSAWRKRCFAIASGRRPRAH